MNNEINYKCKNKDCWWNEENKEFMSIYNCGYTKDIDKIYECKNRKPKIEKIINNFITDKNFTFLKFYSFDWGFGTEIKTTIEKYYKESTLDRFKKEIKRLYLNNQLTIDEINKINNYFKIIDKNYIN